MSMSLRAGAMRHPRLVNALLAIVSLAVGLVLAEVALRYFFKPRAVLTRQLLTGLGVTDSDQAWQGHSDLGWMIKPNQTFRHVSPFGEFDMAVRTDGLGFRVPLDRDPPANADRTILFLGDSVTAAYEVAYEQTFATKVEEKLNGAGKERWRALNAGVRGYSAEQSLKRMRALLERTELGITDVVFLFSQNDTFENMSLHFPKRLMSKPGAYLDQNGILKFLTLDYPVGVFDAEALFVEPGGKVGMLPVIGRKGVSRRVVENKLRYAEPRGGISNLYLVELVRLASEIIASPNLEDVRARYPYIKAEYIPDDDGGYSPGFIDVSWEPGSYPLRLLEEVIHGMKLEADRHQVRLWLSLTLTLGQWALPFFKATEAKYGFTLIDPVSDGFRGRWAEHCGGSVVFKTDGHYSPCGHLGQAEAIAAALATSARPH
jgi:hypothetical protein